jgi:hypothetical protein
MMPKTATPSRLGGKAMDIHGSSAARTLKSQIPALKVMMGAIDMAEWIRYKKASECRETLR